MSFDTNLKRILSERGWSSSKLLSVLFEQGVEVSIFTVERWIGGSNTPRVEHLVALAKALGVEPNDLLADSAEPASAANDC